MGRLIIENNAFENISAHVNNFYKAGYIAVIYNDGFERLALDIASLLDKGNYRTHTIRADKGLADNLSDEYRFFAGVGGADICGALKTFNKPYCVCLTEPSLKCLDSTVADCGENFKIYKGRAAEFTVIDKKRVADGWQSSLWGEIIGLIQPIIDYGVIRYTTDRGLTDSYDKALKIFDEITSPDTPDDDKLFETYAEIANIYPLMNNCDIGNTVRIASELTVKNKNISFGDACMLNAAYYFHAAYALAGSDAELAFPPDKDALAVTAARKYGVNFINCAKTRYGHESVMRYDYVINEYCADLRKMISDRLENMSNACKIWRRLKRDVGYRISRAITIKEIGETVGYASVFGGGYGVLRHYKEMGVA